MSPDARLFLLITPPSIPFGPIETTCAVVGNTDQTHRLIEVKCFSAAKELKQKLKTAGLPEFEIARAIARLHTNRPSFREINMEIAESLFGSC
jgi:hypothetical protein